MEISDANVLMRLVIEEKSVVMSTELKLACLSVAQPEGPGGHAPEIGFTRKFLAAPLS